MPNKYYKHYSLVANAGVSDDEGDDVNLLRNSTISDAGRWSIYGVIGDPDSDAWVESSLSEVDDAEDGEFIGQAIVSSSTKPLRHSVVSRGPTAPCEPSDQSTASCAETAHVHAGSVLRWFDAEVENLKFEGLSMDDFKSTKIKLLPTSSDWTNMKNFGRIEDKVMYLLRRLNAESVTPSTRVSHDARFLEELDPYQQLRFLCLSSMDRDTVQEVSYSLLHGSTSVSLVSEARREALRSFVLHGEEINVLQLPAS